MNIAEFWRKIKDNPEKYLGEGEVSLTKMRNFVDGYQMCLHNNNSNIEYGKYEKFNLFVQKKYNMIISWDSGTIIEFCSKNKVEAFENYFRDLEEFEQLSDEELEKLEWGKLI